MRGGLPGAYPSFKKYLNGVFRTRCRSTSTTRSESSRTRRPKKARGRLIEINNGRLAMIGLFLCGNALRRVRRLDGVAMSVPHRSTESA